MEENNIPAMNGKVSSARRSYDIWVENPFSAQKNVAPEARGSRYNRDYIAWCRRRDKNNRDYNLRSRLERPRMDHGVGISAFRGSKSDQTTRFPATIQRARTRTGSSKGLHSQSRYFQKDGKDR
jgi:hypothetical protein